MAAFRFIGIEESLPLLEVTLTVHRFLRKGSLFNLIHPSSKWIAQLEFHCFIQTLEPFVSHSGAHTDWLIHNYWQSYFIYNMGIIPKRCGYVLEYQIVWSLKLYFIIY